MKVCYRYVCMSYTYIHDVHVHITDQISAKRNNEYTAYFYITVRVLTTKFVRAMNAVLAFIVIFTQ